jgi:hypothetical protein
MFRSLAAMLVVAVMTAQGSPPQSEPPAASPPTVYEVQINGESFLVEANRQTNLESKSKPGVRYEVAVRIASTQPVRLNTLQFDYDLPAKVEVDSRRENPSARLIHELGFSLLVNDLGRPLDSKAQKETLENLLKSVTSTLRDAKIPDINVTKSHERKFDRSTARGITVRYRDPKGAAHVCLLYVLTGPTYSATSVAEFLDDDTEEVLPLIKKTFDSVRAIDHR